MSHNGMASVKLMTIHYLKYPVFRNCPKAAGQWTGLPFSGVTHWILRPYNAYRSPYGFTHSYHKMPRY